MDAKTIAVALVCVMVGAVMFGALIPVFGDVTATEDTFTNTGYYRMSYVETDTDITITWDHTKPHEIVVNSDIVKLPDNPDVTLSIVMNDTWIVRYTGDALQMYLNASSHRDASVSAGTDAEITLSGGTVNWVSTADENNTATTTYTYVYYATNDGPYIMKSALDSAYLKGDSLIYGHGRSYVAGSSHMYRVTGTIDDGITVTDVYPSSGITNGDPIINDQAMNNYIDLYKFDNVSFEVTNENNNEQGTVTYSYVVVPYEVTAERSVHPDESMGVILDIIPLVIGIGLLLLTVAWFLRKY